MGELALLSTISTELVVSYESPEFAGLEICGSLCSQNDVVGNICDMPSVSDPVDIGWKSSCIV
jgi:hypothetical protein